MYYASFVVVVVVVVLLSELKCHYNTRTSFLLAQNPVWITDNLDRYKSILRNTSFIRITNGY